MVSKSYNTILNKSVLRNNAFEGTEYVFNGKFVDGSSFLKKV